VEPFARVQIPAPAPLKNPKTNIILDQKINNTPFQRSLQFCLFMHMHIILFMPKVISLSNEAYQTLKRLKKSGESFSDVVLRVTGKRKKKPLIEFSGTWVGDDIDFVFSQVKKDREQLGGTVA
jgi:predicted CopG family antitoxin